MKQVEITPVVSKQFNVDISTKKFYGASDGGRIRAAIMSRDYYSHDGVVTHKLISNHEFTRANSFDYYEANLPLGRYIEFLIEKGFQIYEFDKLSQLASWLELPS